LKIDIGSKYILSKQLEDVFFGFDKYKTDQSEKKILIKNAKWLKENPSIEVQLAGHCDERGTNNYNIALGQKRSLDIKMNSHY
jgi:peptidoglycan-associated lipoprotein